VEELWNWSEGMRLYSIDKDIIYRKYKQILNLKKNLKNLLTILLWKASIVNVLINRNFLSFKIMIFKYFMKIIYKIKEYVFINTKSSDIPIIENDQKRIWKSYVWKNDAPKYQRI